MDERELLEAGVRKDSFISCICTIIGFRHSDLGGHSPT
jgi:hypothetical protein